LYDIFLQLTEIWDFSALIGWQCGVAVYICVLLTSALRGSAQPYLAFC